MSTIQEVFGMAPVGALILNQKKYQVLPDYTFANPDLLVGIECEIENWPFDIEKQHFGFTFEADGSLRNNGYEAITAPTYTKHVPYILSTLFKRFNITQDNNYSTRCSTHVHVNCQNMTTEQVKMLCLLYQVLERPIFGFIGHERQDNIFCVPWSQCNMSYDFAHKFMRDPSATTRYWQKYTALNILPLRDRGTVEFRHLEGTCDVKRIVNWLNIIGSMVKFACEYSYEEFRQIILDMNSVSNYGAFIEQVLGQHAYLLTDLPTYQEDIALGVVDCKLCLISEVANSKTKKAAVRVEPANPAFDIAEVNRWEDALIQEQRNRAMDEALERALFRPAVYIIDDIAAEGTVNRARLADGIITAGGVPRPLPF
jgi:hypothetical protein